MLKLSRIAIISKEGHGEAKEIARDEAQLLTNLGVSVISFPNLHLKGVDHAPTIRDIQHRKLDLIVTVAGDGTILRVLRALDNTIPCLCVNVGGRGILAELKPSQFSIAIEKIAKNDFYFEHRTRIGSSIEGSIFPPALNEVNLLRQTVSHTPEFTIDLDKGAVFTQRMDGIILSTPTGSTGHGYSYGAPFVDGSLDAFLLTPMGSINRFPTIARRSADLFRIMASYALSLVVDGQEVFNVEPNSYVTFEKHKRDAIFVRFDTSAAYRQLKNLGFT